MKARCFVLLLLLVSGCRMYGSDGSAEALAKELDQVAATLSAERDGIRVNAALLEELAADSVALRPYAARLASLAQAYDVLVESHQALAADAQARGGMFRNNPTVRWVGADRYRLLHRTFGAAIAEHTVLTDRYEALRSDLQTYVSGSIPEASQVEGRYQVAPPYYRRLEYKAQRQELRDILATIYAELE